MDWIDGGAAAKLAWKDSTAAQSYRVTYSRKHGEANILNQMNVGRTEATLRDLHPASEYKLGIYRLTAKDDGAEGTLIAQSVLQTPKVGTLPLSIESSSNTGQEEEEEEEKKPSSCQSSG